MYGIVVTLGIIISLWLSEQDWEQIDKNSEKMWDLALFVIILGIIGARIFHVIDYWDVYGKDYKLILQIWNGGLGIYGALVGGLIALILSSYLNKYSYQKVLKILDVTAYALPFAQFIGRWANYFNNELYGKPTDLPWKIYIPIQNRPIDYLGESYFHPLFLYESIACLTIFFVIYLVKHRAIPTKLKFIDGDFFLLYLSYYGLLRFFLEPLRITHFEINSINVVQAISVGVVVGSGTILIYRRFWRKGYATKRTKAA